jgi:RND family efflux transporter MFP subunit
MTSNRRWLTLAAGALILPAAGLVYALRGAPPETARPEPEAVSVRVAPVQERVIARTVLAPGTFGPKDETRLSFKIGGVIATVSVEAGESVRAGDVLAELDLREIDSALRKARSSATDAERDLERARRLYADSVITLAQLQDAETGAEVAHADLEIAEFNRRYAVITAPANGTILDRSAEPGETVSPGTEILVLGSRERGGVIRVGLADRDVVRVRLGDAGTARFGVTGDRVFNGVVTEIAAAATPSTGTYAVELTLQDAGPLAAGLVGSVEISAGAGEPARVVPVEAVLEADGAGATVFTVVGDGTRVERKEVTLAFISGDEVVVTHGLEGVAAVVTDGAAWLSDGDAVRVLP